MNSIMGYNYYMAKAKETTWHKKCIQQFEQHVDIKTGEIFEPEFKEHVQCLRDNKNILDKAGYPESMYPSMLTKFIRHFGFRFEMKDFIRNFILNNEIDFSLMRSSLSIICEHDNSYILNISDIDVESYIEDYADTLELKIIIPPRATINEIIEFVRLHKDFIKEKQALFGTLKRTRSKKNIKRNLRVMELIDNGKSYKETGKIMNAEKIWGSPLDQADIASIVKRHRDNR